MSITRADLMLAEAAKAMRKALPSEERKPIDFQALAIPSATLLEEDPEAQPGWDNLDDVERWARGE